MLVPPCMWGFSSGPELRCSVPCATPSSPSVSTARELSTSPSFYLTVSQIARYVAELARESPCPTGLLRLHGTLPAAARWTYGEGTNGRYDSLVHRTMDFCWASQEICSCVS